MSAARSNLSRRTLLSAAAGLGGLAAAGIVARAVDQEVLGPSRRTELEPWDAWRADAAAGPLELVRAAVLAASPHNTQPWRFRVAPDRVDLFADEERNLGAIDPDRRELQMALGCALENLVVAAAPCGLAAEVVLDGDGADGREDGDRPVATVKLAARERAGSELADAIPRRHTNRGPYRLERSLSAAELDALAALGADLPEARIVWFRSGRERAAFITATLAATRAIIADAEQSLASRRWLRFDADELRERADGLPIDGFGFSPTLTALLKLLPAPGRERLDASWLRATDEVHLATAPLFGIVVVRAHRERSQRITAGRLWQRIHLAATAAGLAGQPLSQLVERRDRELELGLAPEAGAALGELLGTDSWEAVLPFRLGVAERAASPSPRRSASAVLV